MSDGDERQVGVPTKSLRLALLVFAAIGAFFLLAEHRAHLLPYLPWLLLAACPLMHVFVHHGKHSSSRHDPASRSGSENQGGHNHA